MIIKYLFFSNRQLTKTFKLTNRGRRLQQLVWLTDGYIPLSKAKKEKMRQSMDHRGKVRAILHLHTKKGVLFIMLLFHTELVLK